MNLITNYKILKVFNHFLWLGTLAGTTRLTGLVPCFWPGHQPVERTRHGLNFGTSHRKSHPRRAVPTSSSLARLPGEGRSSGRMLGVGFNGFWIMLGSASMDFGSCCGCDEVAVELIGARVDADCSLSRSPLR
jgi:hypothetical protein